MEALVFTLTGWFINYSEVVLSFAALVVALVAYVKIKPGAKLRQIYRYLNLVLIGLYLVNAAIKTGLQYYIWRSIEVGNAFLPPVTPISYFVEYTASRFWLEPLLGICLALVWTGILYVIGKKSERFFEEGEVELGTLAMLVLRWPLVVAFLPIFAVVVVVTSIVRRVTWNLRYTTFGLPMLIACAITLALTRFVTPMLTELL